MRPHNAPQNIAVDDKDGKVRPLKALNIRSKRFTLDSTDNQEQTGKMMTFSKHWIAWLMGAALNG